MISEIFGCKYESKAQKEGPYRKSLQFVILSERSESKDLLRSPRSTVKLPERSFDCALRAPLRMTYVSVIPAFTVFRILIRMDN